MPIRPRRRASRAAATIILLCSAACQRDEPTAEPRGADTVQDLRCARATGRRGVALGMFARDLSPKLRARVYESMLREIAALGATDVSLTVRIAQRNVRSNDPGPRLDITPSDAAIEAAIGVARSLGLRVLLFPILHLDERAIGVWRGTLRPNDLDAWWDAYRRAVVHYAALAERAGVTTYSVGSELSSLEADAVRWRALIAKTRAHFSGELTYSANWDHYRVPAFWDDLDLVGVSVYYEVSHDDAPTPDALRAGWAPFRDTLRAWAERHDRRYLFTEIGYPSHTAAASKPWDERSRGRNADPQLQAACYRAALEVWADDDRLAGAFWWNWFGPDERSHISYSPRGKPAADVLRCAFKSDIQANR